MTPRSEQNALRVLSKEIRRKMNERVLTVLRVRRTETLLQAPRAKALQPTVL
jgi:hypothetical protein